MRKPKVHRRISWDNSYTECGRQINWLRWLNTWRGVTCKNCLRAKGKR